MKELFGTLADGQQAFLYTIRKSGLTAVLTDCGATLVRLLVPDASGKTADVVLGFDSVDNYIQSDGFLGAIVGRNANRVRGASFRIGDQTVKLGNNENGNNLHSGPDFYKDRIWQVISYEESSIHFRLRSPSGDQGFPGTAIIDVTYTLHSNHSLSISYRGVADHATVFNLTNHSYFNLAGHNHPEKAMLQTLMMPARFFNPDDAQNIPTGELRSVENTPMDFRTPKPLGQDIDADYEPLHLQNGYDHNFEVFCAPCAILSDPESGRHMAVSTDCPGIQVYTANFLNGEGKDGVHYAPRCGVALETQFCPNSVNNPDCRQPFVKAGEVYESTTSFRFF